jgi:peptidoglycan hydrolase-like protein with peptidoglycan-binding domain
MRSQWATALKAAGLNVETIDGWQLRAASSYSFEPVGIMLHHTASNAQSGNMPCKTLVLEGRRDLKGPLSQFTVGRDGLIVLNAAGRCHHAGRGMANRIEQLLADVEPPDYGQGLYDAPRAGAYRAGNKHFIGFECENDGVGERWSPELVDATVKACAALCVLYGWNPLTRVLMHREWTKRKIDPSARFPWRKMIADAVDSGDFEQPEQADPLPPQKQRTLRRGDIGPDVASMQKVLGITADGHFGPITETYVKRFQQKNKLSADGVVGPMTHAKLVEKQKRPILKEWPDEVL